MPRRSSLHALLAALGLASVLLLGLAGCPAPKLPSGPPPEYEDPPAPSWLEAGAGAETAAPDAAALVN